MTVQWRERLESVRIKSLGDFFGVQKPVIGMVHLWPLPGVPGYLGSGIERIIDEALRDAGTLVAGGVDVVMVENMWDLPYYVQHDIPPEEMTAQAVAARAVAREVDVPLGINAVHNGGRVTLAVAVAAGASFIRVCLLTGVCAWDTGELDNGCAAELLRTRQVPKAEHIKLFADVDKKHSVRFPGIDLTTHIEWAEYYLADALIVSGRMTGGAPGVQKVRFAKQLAKRPILIGSGTNADNVAALLKYADGVIVGSGFEKDGIGENPVDLDRVTRFMDVVREVRQANC